MKHSSSISQNLQNYREKFQIHNFKIKISLWKNDIFHPGFFFLERYESIRSIAHVFIIFLYNRREYSRNPCIYPNIFGNQIISENIEVSTRVPGIFPPVVRKYDKNVRNRTYRFISCQEKKTGWKILFFRGEILVLKLRIWDYFREFCT